jgi:hypothetical protein
MMAAIKASATTRAASRLHVNPRRGETNDSHGVSQDPGMIQAAADRLRTLELHVRQVRQNAKFNADRILGSSDIGESDSKEPEVDGSANRLNQSIASIEMAIMAAAAEVARLNTV